MRNGLILSVPVWAAILWILGSTGCGAMGVEKVDFWGAKMEFSQGIDYRVGFNGIDQVDDRRGLKGPRVETARNF